MSKFKVNDRVIVNSVAINLNNESGFIIGKIDEARSLYEVFIFNQSRTWNIFESELKLDKKALTKLGKIFYDSFN